MSERCKAEQVLVHNEWHEVAKSKESQQQEAQERCERHEPKVEHGTDACDVLPTQRCVIKGIEWISGQRIVMHLCASPVSKGLLQHIWTASRKERQEAEPQ